jgi:predicted ATPase/transcriptional regulator with XRE-family HTH domain
MDASLVVTFGDLLRRCRLAAGLTQETLAERTGLGVRSIQHLEGGAHLPHRKTIDRLIRGLGLAPEERSQFARVAQLTTRRREAVSVPSGGMPDDARHRSPGHNLPAPLTSFVGRAADVTAITDLLRKGRLVTLVGVGGCGKTRLALVVAERIRETYPEGVWLVELAPLADSALLPKAIAVAVGVQEQPEQSLHETLVTYLRSRRLLLVLDNCEHLIADCARLTDNLLRACPALAVLATSREALGIAGEVAWRVPSLSIPERGRVLTDRDDPVASLFSAEAAQLFWQRARMVEPSFTLTSENAGAIAEICCRLDGIPLAIELAAARIKVLSAEQVAAHLNDRFQLLTGGSRTALPRQQTLRATLDWSYNLLSDPERTVFRRLSVFAGGFTLDAAEAVGRGLGEGRQGVDQSGGILPPTPPIPATEVLDLVSRLVDKSLVLVEKRNAEARYRLLETVRQYGHERLVDAGEAGATADRLAEWCLTLTERAEAELIGPREVYWLERLEVENDNLRAALRWCQNRSPAVEIRLAGSLEQFAKRFS